MANEAEEQTAIETLDGQEPDGRALKVNEARERQPRGGGGPPGSVLLELNVGSSSLLARSTSFGERNLLTQHRARRFGEIRRVEARSERPSPP